MPLPDQGHPSDDEPLALLAFKRLVGHAWISPSRLHFLEELGDTECAITERAWLQSSTAKEQSSCAAWEEDAAAGGGMEAGRRDPHRRSLAPLGSERPTSSAWSHPDAWVATEVELGGDVRGGGEAGGGSQRSPAHAAVPVAVRSFRPGQAFASMLPLRAAVEEVHRLQQLRHRHLVRALGLGCYMHSTWSEVKSSVFLVEDYAGPLTLARLMKLNQANGWDPQYAYTYADALRWLLQLADALRTSTAKGVHHGDIRAANVFLSDRDFQSAHARLGDLKPHRLPYTQQLVDQACAAVKQRLATQPPPPAATMPDTALQPHPDQQGRPEASPEGAAGAQQQGLQSHPDGQGTAPCAPGASEGPHGEQRAEAEAEAELGARAQATQPLSSSPPQGEVDMSTQLMAFEQELEALSSKPYTARSPRGNRAGLGRDQGGGWGHGAGPGEGSQGCTPDPTLSCLFREESVACLQALLAQAAAGSGGGGGGGGGMEYGGKHGIRQAPPGPARLRAARASWTEGLGPTLRLLGQQQGQLGQPGGQAKAGAGLAWRKHSQQVLSAQQMLPSGYSASQAPPASQMASDPAVSASLTAASVPAAGMARAAGPWGSGAARGGGSGMRGGPRPMAEASEPPKLSRKPSMSSLKSSMKVSVSPFELPSWEQDLSHSGRDRSPGSLAAAGSADIDMLKRQARRSSTLSAQGSALRMLSMHMDRGTLSPGAGAEPEDFGDAAGLPRPPRAQSLLSALEVPRGNDAAMPFTPQHPPAASRGCIAARAHQRTSSQGPVGPGGLRTLTSYISSNMRRSHQVAPEPDLPLLWSPGAHGAPMGCTSLYASLAPSNWLPRLPSGTATWNKGLACASFSVMQDWTLSRDQLGAEDSFSRASLTRQLRQEVDMLGCNPIPEQLPTFSTHVTAVITAETAAHVLLQEAGVQQAPQVNTGHVSPSPENVASGHVASVRRASIVSKGSVTKMLRKTKSVGFASQLADHRSTSRDRAVLSMPPESLAAGVTLLRPEADVFAFTQLMFWLFSRTPAPLEPGKQPPWAQYMGYCCRIATGWREEVPSYWPAPLQGLLAAGWAQDSAARPSMAQMAAYLNLLLLDSQFMMQLMAADRRHHKVLRACELAAAGGGGNGVEAAEMGSLMHCCRML
ncbi:hypothetical protein V8C86DRAFT_2478642 [Haematococcus lacustris]